MKINKKSLTHIIIILVVLYFLWRFIVALQFSQGAHQLNPDTKLTWLDYFHLNPNWK